MEPFLVDVSSIVERRAPPPLSGRYAKIILDAFEGRAPLSLLMFRYEPHQEGPRHEHEESVEIYFTIKGVGTVKFDNVEYEVKPMSILYIPPKTMHQPCNYEDEDWVFIAIFVPPIDLNEIREWK